jgi:regulator of sirC expression with transglutaminase-like and TPR domain
MPDVPPARRLAIAWEARHMNDMSAEVETIGLLDDEDIELDLAALALSELDHQGIDLVPYGALLRDIGDRLETVGWRAQTPEQQGAALAQVLGEDFGFLGDLESYDAPLNTDLVRVLDRRRGLPVSLAILYVAAARRMGWTADALNTPGHVLVRVGDAPGALIDPFSGGRPVSREGLAALLLGALGPDTAPRPEHIAPMSNRGVLVRLLLNQASRAEGAGDPLRALTLYDRMTLVAPDNPDGWWERARLQLQMQDVDAARASLSAMLEVTRDGDRRQLVVAALGALSSR